MLFEVVCSFIIYVFIEFDNFINKLIYFSPFQVSAILINFKEVLKPAISFIICLLNIFNFYFDSRILFVYLTNYVKTKFVSYMEVGKFIRNLRNDRNLLLRELASAISIDSAILSKIERGERIATKEQIEQISSFFNVENEMLKILWLSDKVIYDLKDEEPLAHQVLKVSEERINYGPKQKEQ